MTTRTIDDIDGNPVEIEIEDIPPTATQMLEDLAKLAERIGAEIHEKCSDPQEDASDTTGEKIADAIRKYPHMPEIEIHLERLSILF